MSDEKTKDYELYNTVIDSEYLRHWSPLHISQASDELVEEIETKYARAAARLTAIAEAAREEKARRAAK